MGVAAAWGGAPNAHALHTLPAGAIAAMDRAASASVLHRSADRTAVGHRALRRRRSASSARAYSARRARAIHRVPATVGDVATQVGLRIRRARERRAGSAVARVDGARRDALAANAIHAGSAPAARNGNTASIQAHDAALAGARLRLARLR